MKITNFSNGIRAVSEVQSTKLVHCGFILDIGSLDEKSHILGIAHFWEHMAFKGTPKRNAFQIINTLEVFGGELNAFTTKEKICFYASVLEEYVELAIELLVDITFNSTFPTEEIEKERKVILEEMSMYLNSPEEAITDHFDSFVFDNHNLGTNILGNETSIIAIQQKDFIEFLKHNLDTEKIVFSMVSGIEESRVNDILNKFLADIPKKSSNKKRIPFNLNSYSPRKRIFFETNTQSQVIMGKPSYGRNDDKKTDFFLLNNILGGPSLTSKLNMELRENMAYVYHIDSTYHAFETVGLFSISFGTSAEKVEKSILKIKKTVQKLKNEISHSQLISAQRQLKGQLAMGEENNISRMLGNAKSILDKGYVESLQTVFEKINAITLEDINKVANEMFVVEDFSILIYHPSKFS